MGRAGLTLVGRLDSRFEVGLGDDILTPGLRGLDGFSGLAPPEQGDRSFPV